MKIFELTFNESDTDSILDNMSAYKFEQLLNYYEGIINKLIFSNMVNGIHPFDLSINFGTYKLTFNGQSTHSLRDATNYFIKEMVKIMPFEENLVSHE